MNNEKMNQMIDNAWMNFSNAHHGILFVSKDDFIERIKDDPKFSKKWGLKIEERELSDYELIKLVEEKVKNHEPFKNEDFPKRVITITYNNETIESYE